MSEPRWSITPHHVETQAGMAWGWDWMVHVDGSTLSGRASSPRKAERQMLRAVRRTRRIDRRLRAASGSSDGGAPKGDSDE